MVRVFWYAHWDILHEATCHFDVVLEVFLGMKYHTEEEVSTQFCTFIILGIVCSREVRVLWILVLIYGNGACYYQYCYELR